MRLRAAVVCQTLPNERKHALDPCRPGFARVGHLQKQRETLSGRARFHPGRHAHGCARAGWRA
eukprot:scaffold594493_cov41-Prasinocladus_malaysianus.AAC.1